MRTLIFLVLAAIHMTCATSDDGAAYNYTGCGITENGARSRRTVGGQDASHAEWPWMVYYISKGTLGCGGTILTENCVLTAAHCIDEAKAGFTLHAGLYDKQYIDRDWNVQKRTEAETIIHPDYDGSKGGWMDVAVIRVSEPFDFSKRAVNSACLPTPGTTYAGEDGTALGWGTTSFGGQTASVLQEVEYPIKADSDSMCRKSVADWELCAAHPEKGTCHADSGGPMVVKGADGKWSVVGVNSYSITQGGCINPDFFMRVTYFSEWVQKACKGSGPILGGTEDKEPAADCEDAGTFSQHCGTWKALGYCNYAIARRNCHLTCNKCDDSLT